MIEALLLGGALALSGCGGRSVMNPGNCERYPYEGYNVLVCDDVAVANKCLKRQHAKADITGEPYRHDAIRACISRRPFGRKPVIMVGRSHLNCLLHEVGHYEHPGMPEAWVAARYPCIGDRR